MNHSVLFVDDEAFILEFLEETFTREGYRVFTAGSSEAALDLLTTRNIQIMFLDLHLPGMNGLDLCRSIRRTQPIACIYAMTGYTSLFELADCRAVGFDDYFVKPVNLDEFLKAAADGVEKIKRWRKRSEEKTA